MLNLAKSLRLNKDNLLDGIKDLSKDDLDKLVIIELGNNSNFLVSPFSGTAPIEVASIYDLYKNLNRLNINSILGWIHPLSEEIIYIFNQDYHNYPSLESLQPVLEALDQIDLCFLPTHVYLSIIKKLNEIVGFFIELENQTNVISDQLHETLDWLEDSKSLTSKMDH